jgi:hypothetical protein
MSDGLTNFFARQPEEPYNIYGDRRFEARSEAEDKAPAGSVTLCRSSVAGAGRFATREAMVAGMDGLMDALRYCDDRETSRHLIEAITCLKEAEHWYRSVLQKRDDAG